MSGRETAKTGDVARRAPRIAKFARRPRHTAVILAAALCLALPGAAPAAAAEQGPELLASAPRAETQSPQRLANFSGESASSDARQVADWVVDTGDNRNLPFVIVDKKDAKVFVFGSDGRLVGATPSLLGLARGDDSAPGIGERKLSDIPPDERTTPAGRFVAALGQDLARREVLWVDYGAALSLHRVLEANTREARLQRLASASPGDKRISFGCINVPGKFYDGVVHPVFARTNGVVYILPEIKSIPEVFHFSDGEAAKHA